MYQCQVYSIVVRQSYTLESAPPSSSCIHLAQYIVIIILLTKFPMLYFTSPFCNCQSVLLDPFTFFHPAPQPPSLLATISLFSVSISLFHVDGYIELKCPERAPKIPHF